MEDYSKQVLDVVKNIRSNSPVILMADAVTVFKKLYSGPIKEVSSIEDVRDLVSYYYGIDNLNRPLIIEDLCLLTDSASFLLLKLVEEAKFPIILLSSYDKVSPIILSRCKYILKFSIADVSSLFMSASSGKEAMEEYLSEDSNQMDKYRWMRDNSPQLYYYSIRCNNVSNVDKILKILM